MTEHSSMRVATSRQKQALIRREQIIEAAITLFAQQGFDGTSTRQIAGSIGITEGLIFHYFPTKADLLNAVLESRHGIIGELRRFLDQAEQHTVSEVLPGHSQKGYTRFAAPTCQYCCYNIASAGLLVGECTRSCCRWTQSGGPCDS